MWSRRPRKNRNFLQIVKIGHIHIRFFGFLTNSQPIRSKSNLKEKMSILWDNIWWGMDPECFPWALFAWDESCDLLEVSVECPRWPSKSSHTGLFPWLSSKHLTPNIPMYHFSLSIPWKFLSQIYVWPHSQKTMKVYSMNICWPLFYASSHGFQILWGCTLCWSLLLSCPCASYGLTGSHMHSECFCLFVCFFVFCSFLFVLVFFVCLFVCFVFVFVFVFVLFCFVMFCLFCVFFNLFSSFGF